MAASLALLAATPFMLRYEYTHDGSGSGTVTRTQSQMVTDCQAAAEGPNPLQAFLNGTYSNLQWQALKSNTKVSLHSTNETVAAGTAVGAAFGLLSGTTNALVCAGVSANAGTAIIEMRFNHTLDR